MAMADNFAELALGHKQSRTDPALDVIAIAPAFAPLWASQPACAELRRTELSTKYALTRTLMARRDDGGWMPAYSRFVADHATPLLGQTWRPEKFSVGRGFRGGSVGLGIDFGSSLVQEFWPDLKKKIWKGSKRSLDSAHRTG